MDEHQKEFINLVRSLSDRNSTVLEDFAEMAAISISNALLKDKAREERYLSVVKKYRKEEVGQFPKMLACVVNSLSLGLHDALGEICMSDEMGRWGSDVAFTPYHVSKMMATIALDGVKEVVEKKEFITVCEPACGTGSMIIAAADAMQDVGLSYQTDAHFTATDIRAVFAHMAFIQCSLLHIPAIVIHGDSLSQSVYSTWATPAHYLGFWSAKLRRRQAEQPELQEKGQLNLSFR